MFCTVCEKAKRKNPLVDPVVDAKHSILTKHAMNNDHKVALQDAQLRGQFTRCMEKNNENKGSTIKASFNPGILLLKKNLVNLQIKNGCNDFKNITHQHHSHVTELVEIISTCIEGKTIRILRESPFVGVLLDETSDIRVYKKLVILYPSLVTQCPARARHCVNPAKNREMAPNKSV